MIISLVGLSVNGQKRAKNIREVKSKYVIVSGDAKLEVNPKLGGRIVSLSIDNVELLTDSTVNSFNWGSTFWPSPQSDWNWPPYSVIDNEEYKVEYYKGNEIKVKSRKEPKTGIVVTKTIKKSEKANGFLISYKIVNRGDKPITLAPWEVTRVKPNSLIFFPHGEGGFGGGLSSYTRTINGINWFEGKIDVISPDLPNRKLFADGGEGWIAVVNDDLTFIKRFSDISKADFAPGEAEVEIYASPFKVGKSYIEVEQQGKYRTLVPKASLVWNVEWYLFSTPNKAMPVQGDPSIVEFIRGGVKKN